MYESPPIIAQLGELLRQPIAEVDLRAHTSELESLRYDLADTSTKWLQELYLARKNMLFPKDFEKKFTELDRTTRLHADTSVIEKDLRMLEKLEVLVSERLKLMSQLLEN